MWKLWKMLGWIGQGLVVLEKKHGEGKIHNNIFILMFQNVSHSNLDLVYRYLRRNRSVIANLCMGQVLNRVTCPSCNYTSRIFEPFNMLSLPFPNVSDVLFRCVVIRRATAVNCTKTLNFSEKVKHRLHKPPSKQLIAEEYILPMSRVADISELKVQLVKVCGIDTEKLKLYTIMNGDVDGLSTSDNISLSLIQDDKNGPCWHYSQVEKSEELTNQTTPIFAFETTLNPRPEQDSSMNRKSHDSLDSNQEARTKLLYGDDLECRLYDTNPFPIAKQMSRIMWPKSPTELTEGLRVDAIDHRSHWFPGTVVNVTVRPETVIGKTVRPLQMTLKVHFDNFSTKWDLNYTLEEIRAGKVQPLYSNSRPKDKPLEIQMLHSQSKDSLNLFGLPFFTHCHIEWSNARAGAQILAQASRYLEGDPQVLKMDNEDNIISLTSFDSRYSDVQRRFKEAHNMISKAIDVLIDADKRYCNLILYESPNGATSWRTSSCLTNCSVVSTCHTTIMIDNPNEIINTIII